MSDGIDRAARRYWDVGPRRHRASKPAPPDATLGIYKGGSASAGQHPNVLNEYYFSRLAN